MNFRSMNEYNVFMNTLSGNFFPLTDDNKRPGIVKTIYGIFVWTILLCGLLSFIAGLVLYLPPIQSLQKGGPTYITTFEIFSLLTYLTTQRENMRILISQVNNILEESEDLRQCIRDTVEPQKVRLKVYTFAAAGSVVIFALMPLVNVLHKDRFIYSDYSLPCYVPGAPVGPIVFVIVIFTGTIGATYMMLKKIGIDVYMSYCVNLLTAEYRYVQKRLTAAFDEKDEDLMMDALKKCIQHHCDTMEAGATLVDILSVNIGLTYLICVLRFCFSAFSVITLSGMQLMIVMFAMGSLMQVYVLCSCVQDLLDASTAVADGAFYGNWYERGPTVKSIVRVIVLANRMECRLTSFGVVDLTVPTFATILNQAYSACLFLMTVY